MQQQDASTGYAQTIWELTREAKQGIQVMSKTINMHTAAKSTRHSAKLLIAPLPNECARHKPKCQLLHQYIIGYHIKV